MSSHAEGKVQAYAKRQLKDAGFLVRKIAYEGRNGATDLVAIGYVTAFVEVKDDDEPDAHQAREHERITAHGGLVFTVRNNDEVDYMVRILRFRNATAKSDRIRAVLR